MSKNLYLIYAIPILFFILNVVVIILLKFPRTSLVRGYHFFSLKPCRYSNSWKTCSVRRKGRYIYEYFGKTPHDYSKI